MHHPKECKPDQFAHSRVFSTTNVLFCNNFYARKLCFKFASKQIYTTLVELCKNAVQALLIYSLNPKFCKGER